MLVLKINATVIVVTIVAKSYNNGWLILMHECLLCRVYRQSTVSVQSSDVVITDIMESGSNLLVWLYVQGIAPVQAVISAIEVIRNVYMDM